MKCPFSCSQYGTMSECEGYRCMITDEAGQCLIQQALALYVSGERTKRAEEEERLRKETEAAMQFWKNYKDGTRTPIQFLHQPIDEKHPHGGMYEDMSPYYADGRPKTIIEIERGDPLPEYAPAGTVVVEKY